MNSKVLLGALILGASLIKLINGQTDTTESTCTGGAAYEGALHVTGTGTVTATPDKAEVYLRVEATAANATVARQEAATATNSVIKAVQDAGIPAANITTQDITLYPSYDYVNGESKLRGYTFSQTLKVQIGSLNSDKLGAVVDSAVAAGGNYVQVQNIQLDLEAATRRQANDQAKTQAVDDAKAAADMLAKAAGVTLNGIKDIVDSAPSPPMPYPMAGAAAPEMDMAASTPTPVTIGTTEVMAQVAMTYSFCNPTVTTVGAAAPTSG